MHSLSNLFPVNLTAQWQNQPSAPISAQLMDWLFDPTSLTARLNQHCQSFHVEVLGQEVIACPADEACEIVSAGEKVLAREVLLYCDNQPHVFARSLLPLTSLTGEQELLAELGDKPLGQVIFNNPSLERKLIQIAPFNEQSSVGQLAQALALSVSETLWGRRSLFYLEAKPLIVAEVFLPPALAYQ